MSSESKTPIGTEPDLPGATPADQKPKKVGGFQSHKPGCRCYPCKARRRKEEAELGADGISVEVKGKALNADDPDSTVLQAQDRTPRGRIATWIAIRAQEPNLTNVQIAEKMGISRTHLQTLITRATREGWLKFDNPLDKLEHELTPLAVKNLHEFLREGDKTTTLEFARGVLYPMYKESKGVTENKQSILAIKIEFPKPETMPTGEIIQGTKVITGGSIVGRPKSADDDDLIIDGKLAN
jgi:hypothetical protein